MSDEGPSRKVVYGASAVAVVIGIVAAIAGAIVARNALYGIAGGAVGAGVVYKLLELAFTD